MFSYNDFKIGMKLGLRDANTYMNGPSFSEEAWSHVRQKHSDKSCFLSGAPIYTMGGACQGPPGDQTQDAHPIALCIHPEEQYDAEYDLYCIATYIHILHLHSGFVTCYYHFSK